MIEKKTEPHVPTNYLLSVSCLNASNLPTTKELLARIGIVVQEEITDKDRYFECGGG